MDKQRIGAFAEKVYGDMAGAMAMGMAYVGVKNGLFNALSGKGPMCLDEILELTDLQPRYVEEWLKGMTAARYLDYDPSTETYELCDEHAFLVASEGTDHFMGGLFCIAPSLLSVAPKVADAFRTGGGVRFEDFGAETVAALDMINRGHYEQRLSGYWLKSMPDIVEKLESGGRVLDVGCGVGRVSVAIAKTFPNSHVVGLDPDAHSIEQAAAVAAMAGVGGNIEFVKGTTGDLKRNGGFDLITACDCVHDFSEPGRTLKEIHDLLGPDGAFFIIEPKAADRLEDNVHSIGTVYYGFSIFHCMTQSLAEGGPGLGTCMGPAQTERLLREAGFTGCDRLDIRSQTHLFYAARK